MTIIALFIQLYNLISWTINGVKVEPDQTLSSAKLPWVIVTRPGDEQPDVTQPAWRASRTGIALVAGAVAIAVAATVSIVAMGRDRVRTPPPDQPQPAARPVVALGRLAPVGELRSLAAPFGAGDARVDQVLVTEGQSVQAGAPLVVFDNADALGASLKVASDQLASRQAALVQAERHVASSQAESAAALARAEVSALLAEAEYLRWVALVDQGYVSPASIDQRRAQRDEAAHELRRARAVVARHAGEGAAQPELRAAQLAVAVAAAERERAAQDLTKSVLRAPADGTVIAIRTRPGERPGAAGVLDFGDTRTMTAELELYEVDAARVRVGQHVRLLSPALSEDLVGEISHIGLLVGRQQRIDTSPAANLDARVIKATVMLDSASSARARSRVGLEVRAQIAAEPL